MFFMTEKNFLQLERTALSLVFKRGFTLKLRYLTLFRHIFFSNERGIGTPAPSGSANANDADY
jgi:hypothetical protein